MSEDLYVPLLYCFLLVLSLSVRTCIRFLCALSFVSGGVCVRVYNLKGFTLIHYTFTVYGFYPHLLHILSLATNSQSLVSLGVVVVAVQDTVHFTSPSFYTVVVG